MSDTNEGERDQRLARAIGTGAIGLVTGMVATPIVGPHAGHAIGTITGRAASEFARQNPEVDEAVGDAGAVIGLAGATVLVAVASLASPFILLGWGIKSLFSDNKPS